LGWAYFRFSGRIMGRREMTVCARGFDSTGLEP
jgi:hypothetical protein